MVVEYEIILALVVVLMDVAALHHFVFEVAADGCAVWQLVPCGAFVPGKFPICVSTPVDATSPGYAFGASYYRFASVPIDRLLVD